MVRRSQLQLLAATCLHIASKVEDEEPINVTELHYCADRMYDIEDVVNLEEETLEILAETIWNAATYVSDWLCEKIFGKELVPPKKDPSDPYKDERESGGWQGIFLSKVMPRIESLISKWDSLTKLPVNVFCSKKNNRNESLIMDIAKKLRLPDLAKKSVMNQATKKLPKKLHSDL